MSSPLRVRMGVLLGYTLSVGVLPRSSLASPQAPTPLCHPLPVVRELTFSVFYFRSTILSQCSVILRHHFRKAAFPLIRGALVLANPVSSPFGCELRVSIFVFGVTGVSQIGVDRIRLGA